MDDKTSKEIQQVNESLSGLQERVRLLEEENRVLRREIDDTKRQINAIEKENWDFYDLYILVERQNKSLLNLHVASQRLHSTLGFRDVIKVLEELLSNLVGSESFAISLHQPQAGGLVVISEVGSPLRVGEGVPMTGPIARVLESGDVYISEHVGVQADDYPLVACIPLWLAGQVVGVITIHSLLVQKPGVEAIDRTLFEHLGEHAAAAICAAHLFSKSRLKEEKGWWSEHVDEIIIQASNMADASP